MTDEENKELREKICAGLRLSYQRLLLRKAALGQDMVFADEQGMPKIVPAREALAEYERRNGPITIDLNGVPGEIF